MKRSLQAIKNDIVKKEETLKALQKTYPHLAHLPESQLLAYFNFRTIDEINKYIKHTQEYTQAYDDASLQDTQLCSCSDSKGHLKDLYHSEELAQREANILAKQQKLSLTVYLCPSHCGWHLSKR